MIVKIQTVDEGWVFYKVIRKVKERILTKEQYNFGLETHTPNRVEVNTDKNCVGELKIIRFDDIRDCGDFIVYTNLSVYLLNDEGKTIERLN